MSNSSPKRRMTENEVIFRKYNERVKQSFDEIKKLAMETGQEYLIPDDDTPLHFYCECSDENCRQRILLKPSVYDKIHKNRKHFVTICGHESGDIERIVRNHGDYCVVEKFMYPPESAHSLSPTGVDNS